VRIVSWNINSIRARIDHLVQLMDRLDPDVVLLQETRCPDLVFPTALFADRGYAVAHHSLDHRNGVAIASRVGLSQVRYGFRSPLSEDGTTRFDDARLISGVCQGIRFYSVYVPNGRTLDDPQYTYKLAWLEHLRVEAQWHTERRKPVVFAGDFNVAPADLDIYDPSRFRRTTHASPPERAAIVALTDAGLIDAMRSRDASAGLYTWWSYAPAQVERNRGLRIDLIVASRNVDRRITNLSVDRTTRELHRASDHAPVLFEIAPKSAPTSVSEPG
jgi:exodeoxyribonuclease III